MDKRERLEKTIAGEETDRVPVALWRHWPGDDQRAADMARSAIEFQKTYDWDFVKVMPSSSYCVADYGVQSEWQGNVEGTRVYTKRAIVKSLDWTELRPLDPTRGHLGIQLDALELISQALTAENVPFIMTIFSPLSQAKNIAGQDTLIRHMRTQPDRLHSGLNILTDSILRFIDAIKRTSVAGIFYAIQHASYDVMAEDEYRAFGMPYDRKILDALPQKWWFNMLHLHGTSPMFRLVADYPIQSINWHSRESEPNLAQGKTLFAGAVSGGLSQSQHLQLGTPATMRDAVRDSIEQTNGRRLILASECVALITSPWSNLRAVRDAVETVKL